MPDLLNALAAQAVEIQRLHNAAYISDLQEFEAVVAATPVEEREPLRPLAPPRMLVKSFDLSFGLTVAQEREVGFGLQAFPINFNYSHRHSIKYENQSRMAISVVQRPLAVPDVP
jgi:hypothetical protein